VQIHTISKLANCTHRCLPISLENHSPSCPGTTSFQSHTRTFGAISYWHSLQSSFTGWSPIPRLWLCRSWNATAPDSATGIVLCQPHSVAWACSPPACAHWGNHILKRSEWRSSTLDRHRTRTLTQDHPVLFKCHCAKVASIPCLKIGQENATDVFLSSLTVSQDGYTCLLVRTLHVVKLWQLHHISSMQLIQLVVCALTVSINRGLCSGFRLSEGQKTYTLKKFTYPTPS